MALHQRLSTTQQAAAFGAVRPCPCIHSIASPALPQRRLPFTPSSTPPHSSSSYGSNSSSGSSRRQLVRAADAGSLSGPMPEEPLYNEKPFPRLRERDPYRLLGVAREASFEEIQDARNFLHEQYKWHEESREAIEMAFDTLLQRAMKGRWRFGFKPPRTGRKGENFGIARNDSMWSRFMSFFDPTVTMRTLINEGAVFGAFALWVLFSSDQSFPLAGAFAYSVYQFQSKRVKRDPEGPFLGGNAIVGAILSTLLCLAVACGVMAVLTPPLTTVLGQSSRQVGGFITIAVMGAIGIYLK